MRISSKDFREGVSKGTIKVNGRRGFKKKTINKKEKADLTHNKYIGYVPSNTLISEKVGRSTKYKWSDNDILFDSEGEAFIYLWLIKLIDNGYIDKIESQPEPFKLSEAIKRSYKKRLKTKDKIVEEHVETSQIYTPDFKVYWNKKAFDDNIVIEFNSDIKKEPHHIFSFEGISYIEAKPDGLDMKVYDDNNMIRLFKSKQKEVYSKFSVYINLVFHNKLFSQTFMPERYTFNNRSVTNRSIRYEYKTLKEFIDSIKPKNNNNNLLF